jgi:hypothetical protein
MRSPRLLDLAGAAALTGLSELSETVSLRREGGFNSAMAGSRSSASQVGGINDEKLYLEMWPADWKQPRAFTMAVMAGP